MVLLQRTPLRAARLLVVLVLCIATVGFVPPANAQTPVQVVDAEELQLDIDPIDLENLSPLPGVQQLGFNDVEGRVLRGMTMPVTVRGYGFGDDPNGTPLITPPGTNLIGVGNAQVNFPGPLDMPASGTMTADTVYLESGGGITPGNDVTLVWFEFDSPVDLNQGLAINEGALFARSNVPGWVSEFDGDTFVGSFFQPTTTYNPNPFELTGFRFDGTGFITDEFPGFYYRNATMMFVGVETDYLLAEGPLDELRYGMHLHWSEAPRSPGFVTGYPTVEANRPPEAFPMVRTNPAIVPNTYCCYIEPVEETTTTTTTAPPETTEAPATTEATTTTVTETTATPTETTLAGGGNLESGSFREWVPIILIFGGIAIVIGGYWVYYKTRERPRPGTDTGGGEEEDDDDDPRDTPVPAIYGEELERPRCDWAVYFHDGTKWVPLRQAQGVDHECCVYRIKVRTRIRSHVQAAKARQDVLNADERLYIPDYNFSWQGLNLKGNASTRSGPKGRLDWMHGLGDPTEQADLAPDEEFYQIGQGDEPPEIAVHLEHSEITRVEVDLEAGCPDYENTYEGWGSSTLDVLATQECTNDAPADECPVELNAFGWTWGEVWGDVNYYFGDSIGTDIDEIEGLMRRRAELDPTDREDAAIEHQLKPLWDGHDHEMRDRATYEYHGGDTDTNVTHDDHFVMWIVSEYELDSAQLVPVHVWPTTERVSTHIDTDVTHAVDVDGSMIAKNCDSNGCGGHGDCGCAPKFKIKFDAAVTTIEVDDKKFRIKRDPESADRREPPERGGYKSWKLV